MRTVRTVGDVRATLGEARRACHATDPDGAGDAGVQRDVLLDATTQREAVVIEEQQEIGLRVLDAQVARRAGTKAQVFLK